MIRRRMDYGRKGRERWQWRVSVKGHKPRHGTCPTKGCALECAKRAELELRSGPGGGLPLSRAIDRYEAEYLPRLPGSATSYRRHLAYWRKRLGERSIGSVTPPMVAACRAELKATPSAGNGQETKRPRSNATVNRYLNTLASLFTWAMSPEVGMLTRNVVREVERLPESSGRVRWLSRPVDGAGSELERLLAACRASKSPILLDLVTLLLSTGCRAGEILSLRRADVRPSEGGFTLPAERTKPGEARFVPLSGPGLEIAKRRLAMSSHGPFLFPGSARGKHAAFPYPAWRIALKAAGISDFRPHDLRHTHGSYLAMMGKSLPEIMQALGHKTAAVTLRYAHLAGSHQRKVSEEINAQLSAWFGDSPIRP